MHYPKGKNIVVSYGILSQIEDKYINHKCNTDKGSFGSPIMSLNTLKVIGMHSKGTRKPSGFNIGIFIKYAIYFSQLI